MRDVADEKGTIGPEAAGELLELRGSEIQFEEPVHHFKRQGAVGRAAAEACTHRNALFDPNGHGSYAVFVPKQTPRLCREVIKRVPVSTFDTDLKCIRARDFQLVLPGINGVKQRFQVMISVLALAENVQADVDFRVSESDHIFGFENSHPQKVWL